MYNSNGQEITFANWSGSDGGNRDTRNCAVISGNINDDYAEWITTACENNGYEDHYICEF